MSPPTERRLGRGLEALIPRGDDGGLQEIGLDRIEPNPLQPRTAFDENLLEELAQSIREHGILQPVIVSRAAAGTFQLVAGERRWRAAKLAGLRTIQAVVKEASPRSRLEMALVENLQRRDLNALEEAHAYRALIDEHGLTQEQLSRRIGRNRVTISNTLRLLQLPAPVQGALARGDISEGHARAILGAPGSDSQLALLARVTREGLNVRQTEQLSRQGGGGAQTAIRTINPDVARLEDAFRQALGTKVQLTHGRRGGKLVIHFFSDDELQGLFEAIVGRELR